MSAYKEKMIDAVKRGYEGLCDELGEKAQSINIKGNYLNIPFMPDYTFATDDLDFLFDAYGSYGIAQYKKDGSFNKLLICYTDAFTQTIKTEEIDL